MHRLGGGALFSLFSSYIDANRLSIWLLDVDCRSNVVCMESKQVRNKNKRTNDEKKLCHAGDIILVNLQDL